MPPVLSEARRRYPGQASGCRHCDTAKEAQSQRVCDSGPPACASYRNRPTPALRFSRHLPAARVSARRTEQRGPAPLHSGPRMGTSASHSAAVVIWMNRCFRDRRPPISVHPDRRAIRCRSTVERSRCRTVCHQSRLHLCRPSSRQMEPASPAAAACTLLCPTADG